VDVVIHREEDVQEKEWGRDVKGKRKRMGCNWGIFDFNVVEACNKM